MTNRLRLRMLFVGCWLFLFSAATHAAIPEQAVVWVRAGREGVGTGWLVDLPKRWLITNYHIVGESNRVEVFFPVSEWGRIVPERDFYLAHQHDLRQRGRLISGRVIQRSPSFDLALIQLDSLPDDAIALPLATQSPALGERLDSLGHRHDSPLLWNRATGIVRQHGRLDEGYPWRTQTLAKQARVLLLQSPIIEGDSGGPVCNARGEVVGVIAAWRPRTPGVTIAISRNHLVDWLVSAQPIPPEAMPPPAIRATVWLLPDATDQRPAGWVWADQRRLIITSARAMRGRSFVPVIVPGPSSEESAYRDRLGLKMSGLWRRAWLLAKADDEDIAILELDGEPLPNGLTLGEPPRPGAECTIISHPLGIELRWLIGQGIVRQVGQLRLSDAEATAPGLLLQVPHQGQSSGGPVLDASGRLIGQLTAREGPNQQLGYASAVTTIRAVLDRHRSRWQPESLDEKMLRVRTLWQRGLRDEAVKWATTLSGLHPNDPAVWALRCEIRPDDREAIEAGQRLAPRDARFPVALARLHLSRNEWVAARQAASEAIRLDPENALGYAWRAEAWRQSGDRAEAMADIERALERRPTIVQTYRTRAQLAREQQQWERALADWERVGELVPFDREATFARARIWEQRQEWKKARGEWQSWCEFAPDDADALESLGAVQLALREDDAAIRAWVDALRADPKRRARLIRAVLAHGERVENHPQQGAEVARTWYERFAKQFVMHHPISAPQRGNFEKLCRPDSTPAAWAAWYRSFLIES